MKRIAYIISAILVLSIAACELTVNVDLPEHEPKLVVNARLDEGRPIQIEVTKSRPILSDSAYMYEVIDDAKVLVVRNGVDSFEMNYNSNFEEYAHPLLNSAKSGTTYEVFVSHPDFESVNASTTVPIPVKINNMELAKNVETDLDGNSLSRLRFELDDPSGEDNYYAMIVSIVDSMGLAYSVCYQSNDPVLSGQTDPLGEQGRPEYCGGELFDDNLMTQSPYEMEIYFNDQNHRGIDSIFIRLSTFDEASYLYERSLRQQEGTIGNPFAEPVIVYNNIENGLGIFGSQSHSETSVIW